MTTFPPDKRALAVAGVVLFLIASGAGLWFWSIQSEAARHRADPEDLGQVALGEVVYRTHCAACHGAKLEGQPNWRERKPDGKLPAPPHDETGHTWHHADNLLFEMTKYGMQALAGDDYKTRMPVYEGTLSDDDIVAALSYIKSQWPDKVIQIHNEQINQ